MTSLQRGRRHRLAGLALMALVAGTTVVGDFTLLASPALAQESTMQEIRLRKLEAEVRALQRQVFPGGDGKMFPADGTGAAAGVPATTAVTDLLTRVDALESQNARLTSQNEELANRLRQLEARGGIGPAAPAPSGPTPSVAKPDPAPAPTPLTPEKSATASLTTAMTAKPAATTPAKPSPQRVAAVKAIVKPQTADAGEDDYTYGLRLWQAKFYPEAQQQLKLFIDKYPKHARLTYARNLLGRAYLDDGKPREAAPWFLQNYQTNKRGDRAADSLLYLAQAMVEMKDTNRACIALGEFADTYRSEADGRLKAQLADVRGSVKCN